LKSFKGDKKKKKNLILKVKHAKISTDYMLCPLPLPLEQNLF